MISSYTYKFCKECPKGFIQGRSKNRKLHV